MPFVKSLRDVRVASLKGYIVNIKARTPTEVPAIILDEAMALGCVVCDEKGRIAFDGEIEIPVLKDDDIPFLTEDDRKDLAKVKGVVTKAIVKVYKKNDRSDFDKNNVPKPMAVSKLVGFQVTGELIASIVETLQDAGN